MPDEDKFIMVGSDIQKDIQPDSLSIKEEKNFSKDLRDAARGPLKWILRIVLFSFLAVFLVRVIHLVIPECRFWLSVSNCRQLIL